MISLSCLTPQCKNGLPMPEATNQITGLLRERHHINPKEPEDFNIRRPEDVIQAQLQTSNIMTILLASIASLSLLVGGIGIMNIMLVSVTQRTREIGVRLAVGATEWDVQLQFLSEAIVLGLLGGVFGWLTGYLSSILVEDVFAFPTQLTYQVFVFAGIFSVGIGILFGYYPARKASLLDPIQGLRFE
jgi:ABC-type antimicrobial peptide transport system permease subunit